MVASFFGNPSTLSSRPQRHEIVGSIRGLRRGVEGSERVSLTRLTQGVLPVNCPGHRCSYRHWSLSTANQSYATKIVRLDVGVLLLAVWGERLEAAWQRTLSRDPSTPRQSFLEKDKIPSRSGRDDRHKRSGRMMRTPSHSLPCQRTCYRLVCLTSRFHIRHWPEGLLRFTIASLEPAAR